MQTFLFGFLGALLCMGLIGTGAAIGWRAHRAFSRPKAEKPEERERKRLIEEQEAFHQIQNYNVEQAYGLHKGQYGTGGETE